MEAKVAAMPPPATAEEAKKGEIARRTNAELFTAYNDAVASKTDSKKFNALRLQKFCADPIAELRVVETTTHDINLWIQRSLAEPPALKPGKRAKQRLSGATVNRELNLMSGAFSYAVKASSGSRSPPATGQPGRRRPHPGLAPSSPLTRSVRSKSPPATTGTPSW